MNSRISHKYLHLCFLMYAFVEKSLGGNDFVKQSKTLTNILVPLATCHIKADLGIEMSNECLAQSGLH